jgi:hypothetical protein
VFQFRFSLHTVGEVHAADVTSEISHLEAAYIFSFKGSPQARQLQVDEGKRSDEEKRRRLGDVSVARDDGARLDESGDIQNVDDGEGEMLKAKGISREVPQIKTLRTYIRSI